MASPVLISLVLLGLVVSSHSYAMVRVGRSDVAAPPFDTPNAYYVYETKPVFKRQISADWFNPRSYYMSDEFERDLREHQRLLKEEEELREQLRAQEEQGARV